MRCERCINGFITKARRTAKITKNDFALVQERFVFFVALSCLREEVDWVGTSLPHVTDGV
ncbi:MAG: hypothetical protein DMF92_17175 [Acidobacteria bacterium]|nr:MAG: hypothetical protein DMF92_17175 [Acidobacteriota bacterium]